MDGLANLFHSYSYSYICLLLAGLTCLLSAHVFHALYLHRLAHIPGPRLAALTNLYHVYHIYLRSRGEFRNWGTQGWRWEEDDLHRELHARYGLVVRYGPNLVLVNLPHALPQIYHRQADKTPYYEYSARTLNDAAAGPDKANSKVCRTSSTAITHADHVVTKRRIAYAYSQACVRMFEPEVDARIRQWIGTLHSRYRLAGEPMPVHTALGFLAYDIGSESPSVTSPSSDDRVQRELTKRQSRS